MKKQARKPKVRLFVCFVFVYLAGESGRILLEGDWRRGNRWGGWSGCEQERVVDICGQNIVEIDRFGVWRGGSTCLEEEERQWDGSYLRTFFANNVTVIDLDDNSSCVIPGLGSGTLKCTPRSQISTARRDRVLRDFARVRAREIAREVY